MSACCKQHDSVFFVTRMPTLAKLFRTAHPKIFLLRVVTYKIQYPFDKTLSHTVSSNHTHVLPTYFLRIASYSSYCLLQVHTLHTYTHPPTTYFL
jgi:hypothetical protein